ncbi:hypothetical protein [Polyangium mundeleinium]|uniref:Tetratricopeptide repeat protein n=1 Tax=Polyangium mundeleinium TaxID=2995306 RepID=A0ABT5ELU2_9BACT|nr:hypothetical protein [Polyangium mundeleinium]MDC0742808.1 hypothetical protein [Polyangium mundeleinium]
MESGDRALAAGRLNDAADAYEDALNIKLDARLLGRLGLVLSMFQQTPENDIVIARALHAAVSDAAGASSAERKQFFEAYERVRKRVCRLDVMTSDVDATVLIGGRDVGRSEGAFWTFISPGKTNVTATLTGREDLKKTAECVGGKSMLLEFEFPNPAQAPPQVITLEKEAKERRVVVREAVRTAPPAREPSPPKVEAPSSRFGGGIGPVMVWGAAPSVSVGISASGFIDARSSQPWQPCAAPGRWATFTACLSMCSRRPRLWGRVYNGVGLTDALSGVRCAGLIPWTPTNAMRC